MGLALPFIIGHRGAAGLAPENTLASFRTAAGRGARMVEFDVRLSSDGRPVVFHDDTLERCTDGSGPVAARSLAELKRLDAGAWFGDSFRGESIPTLEEVLALCRDLDLAINLEIKPDRGREIATARATLTAALAVWPSQAPPPLISSFAWDCLDVAADLAPDWPRGLLCGAVPEDWRDQTRRRGCFSLHADHAGLDAKTVAAVAAAGLSVLAYTVNDPARREVLRSLGVAAIFTDVPDSSSIRKVTGVRS